MLEVDEDLRLGVLGDCRGATMAVLDLLPNGGPRGLLRHAGQKEHGPNIEQAIEGTHCRDNIVHKIRPEASHVARYLTLRGWERHKRRRSP